MPTKIIRENLKRRDRLGDVGLDGRITLKLILKIIGCKFVDWIHMDQDRIKWRAFLKTIMKFRVA
jgi:hypothetical protein